VTDDGINVRRSPPLMNDRHKSWASPVRTVCNTTRGRTSRMQITEAHAANVRRSVVQTDGRRRGGWNTAIARCFGWRSLVSDESKDSAVKANPGTDAIHAHDSGRTSIDPVGTAGEAGCPEHNAPEQGRGNAGTGRSSDCPVRSWNRGSISDESRTELVRELTSWEQPASATVGAIMASTRSIKMAPAGRPAGRLKVKDFVITRGSGENYFCILGNACNATDQARECEEAWIIYTWRDYRAKSSQFGMRSRVGVRFCSSSFGDYLFSWSRLLAWLLGIRRSRRLSGLLRLLHALKDIFALQGDLKGVRNTGHVMATARPEEDIEGTFRAEVID
jgi:hypothetical protein